MKGSLTSQLSSIYRKEGLVGFFSGIYHRVARISVGATVYITLYELFLHQLQK